MTTDSNNNKTTTMTEKVDYEKVRIWVVETGVTRKTLMDLLHGLDDVDIRKNDKKAERVYSLLFSPNTIRPLIEKQDNKYVVAMTHVMCDRLVHNSKGIEVRITPYRYHSLWDFPKPDEQSARSLYMMLPVYTHHANDFKGNDPKKHRNCVQWNVFQKLEELTKIGILPPNSYKVVFRHRDNQSFAFVNFSSTVEDVQVVDCRVMLDHSLWVRNTFPRCICRFARINNNSNDNNNNQNNNNHYPKK